MDEYYESNYVKLRGELISEVKYSHTSYNEDFFTFTLKIQRLSKTYDYVPVMISGRLFDLKELETSKLIEIEGQYRSYNNTFNENGNRLILLVFVKQIQLFNEEEQIKNPNYIRLNGYICKKPVYRQTPFGREISDVLLAVNRQYRKSDYIPCIVWGRNAKFVSHLDVGTKVTIHGRIQSREYEKRLDEVTVISKVAYEVSTSRIEVDEGEES